MGGGVVGDSISVPLEASAEGSVFDCRVKNTIKRFVHAKLKLRFLLMSGGVRLVVSIFNLWQTVLIGQVFI